MPADERFGIEETPTLLDVLEEDGYLRHAEDDRYYWSHENFPATDFSLRSGAPENVVIVDTTGDRHRVLGEVDLFAAPLLVHEKAIYIHEGVQHHVDRLDWEERKAYVTRTDVDYYTDADLGITLEGARGLRRGDRPGGTQAARRGDGRLEGDHVQEAQVPHPRERRLGLDQHPGAGDAHHRLLACPPGGLVNRYDRDTLDGALIGLARVARTTASLLLMCDPRDLGVLAQVQAPFTGQPTLYLYDAVPGGVGLTERLFTLTDELIRACAGGRRIVRLRRWLPGLRWPGHRGRRRAASRPYRAAGRARV